MLMDENKMNDLYEQSKKIQEYLNMNSEEINYDLIYEEYGLDIKKLEEDMLNFSPKLGLGYVKLHQDAVEPKYNYDGDSGFDLYSVEEITIKPLGRALIPTGLSFDISDGHEIQVRSKSGLAINQGLFVLLNNHNYDKHHNHHHHHRHREIEQSRFHQRKLSIFLT